MLLVLLRPPMQALEALKQLSTEEGAASLHPSPSQQAAAVLEHNLAELPSEFGVPAQGEHTPPAEPAEPAAAGGKAAVAASPASHPIEVQEE